MAESAVPQNPSATDFIKVSCRATLYPAVCVHCLSTFADKIQQNERELAQAALSVSLARARSTAMFVSKMFKASGLNPRVYQAVRDCVDNMGDSVDQLRRSAKELSDMGRVSGQDFMWHASNVQTWVSAALTDENTCLDGFSGHAMDGNVKAAIKKKVVYVGKVTSNALALVNRFAARHRAGAATSSVP
ncbi:unnamed protein product [Ilex paraguariensis]